MLADKDRIFTNLYGQGDWTLAGARARGAWQDTATFIERGRDWITNEVKGSGLRGRGGAGFPTALKWTFMPKVSDGRPHYLVVNADESEPGTCKDRDILRHDPHHLVEGALLAGRAMDAHTAIIYVRGEFIRERRHLEHAVEEAYEARLIGKDNVNGWDFDIIVHHGAGAYICGERRRCSKVSRQKAAAEAAIPRAMGVWGCPTTVNNVESIAVVPEILRRGGAWFAGIGRANNTGTKLMCVSGHVNTQATFEEAMGITFEEMIESTAAASAAAGQPLAVIPGGASVPCVPARRSATP